MICSRRLAGITFSAVALTFACAHPARAQFETRATLAAQKFPFSIAVGDFNQDGKLDLAVASCDTDTGFATDVQIFLGNGDGTFQTAIDYTVGVCPDSVAAADFNHDGKLDLVVSNSQSDDLSVLLGNGDGTFQPAITIPSPPDPIFVAVGDFNGDGNQDIATLNLSDQTGRCDCVAVFLGNGDGTFQQSPIITTPSLIPLAIGLGHFTGSKTLDLAIADQFGGTNQVEIWLGNGDGTFRRGTIYPVGADPTSIAVADFNGDHRADLAVAEYEGVGIGVLLGNGDGTFGPRVDYRTSFPYWVTAADLTGNGVQDLVAATVPSSGDQGLAVLGGRGDGTFEQAKYYPDGNGNFFVATGDFNGDHLPDLAVADYFNNTVITVLNTGTVAFSPTTPLSFKKQAVGTKSDPQQVTLANTSTADLKISSMKAAGQFEVSSNCGKGVAAGKSCDISVTFSPKSRGPKSGTVTIIDSASSKPQVIELSGTGT